MIDLYYWPTPNGWKVTIMLEECGLDYNVVPVNIGIGDQFEPGFLKISPNNRMPAIIDNDPLGGGAPLSIFESGAIVEYLADKTGKFLSKEPAERFKVLQWVYWQMANLGPAMGQANHFKNYMKDKNETYAVERFANEVNKLAGLMDRELAAHAYLAGDEYTIADMMTWPWAMLLGRTAEDAWETFPNLKRWVDEVGARPAVDKGWQVAKEWRDRKRTPEEEEKAKQVLFGQTAKTVTDAARKAG